MNDISLRRGDGNVTFKKVPDSFALRMKSGRARDARTLAMASGRILRGLDHVMGLPQKLDLFAIQDAGQLDGAMDQLRAAPAVDVVSHVYQLDDNPASTVVPTGYLTLQFSPEVSDRDRQAIFAEYGLELIEDLDYLPHGYTVRLSRLSKKNPLKLAAKLQSRSELLCAEPDITFRAMLNYSPNDTLYREQWHLNNRGDMDGLKAGADVRAEAAWEITRGSRDIVVCVMDDGFDLAHPDFAGAGKLVAPGDFGQEEPGAQPWPGDENHGTACAGIAIAEENGVGTVGIAPGCAFMPIRMSTALSDETVVAMFRHAIEHQADVISCSWSAASWDFPLSTKLKAIIHHAATQGRRNGKGCVIVFAVGNENRPLAGTKDGRISHQGFALHPDVIAVGATNSQDTRAGYSNYGPELVVCAPSSGCGGRGVVTTDRRRAQGYEIPDYTHGFGGTSSATPLVAGLAGLILSAKPELASWEVKRILMESADKVDAANGQYDPGGHSSLFGHGRINAQRALRMALGLTPTSVSLETLAMEHRVNRPIPDQSLVEDVIPFPAGGTVREMEVNLDIHHTDVRDLKITLTSPEGKEIVLHDRASGGAKGLTRSLRSCNEPALFAPVIGAGARGDWKLRVADMAAADSGVLVKWGLSIGY